MAANPIKLKRSDETERAPPHAAEPGESPATRRARPRNLVRPVLMIGGPVLVLLVAGFFWAKSGRYVSTDNAYVQSDKLIISTDVAGVVKTIAVREGDLVKTGQTLYSLDPQPFQIALDKARAQLAETALNLQAMKQDYRRMLRDIEAQAAKVDLDQAQFGRYEALAKNNFATRADYDTAKFRLVADQRAMDSLKQQAAVQLSKVGGNIDAPVDQHPQYRQGQSVVDEAQRQLDHAVARAPFDGMVTQVSNLQPGMYLAAATPAFSLVAMDHVWVTANPKETDLTFVKTGDPASVTVDAYPGHEWKCKVESISPASGAEFSLLPAQNSSGNWVKVVQRIPLRVRCEPNPGEPLLRSGMSANIEIDTGHKSALAALF